MTDRPRDRVYHGVNGSAPDNDMRIYVVEGGGGPTERHRATVLYQLAPRKPFWWGYGGSGPGRTAAAIIDDVLPDLAADNPAFNDLPHSLRSELTRALVGDFVAHLHDEEFWLPAQAVIRWMHGYAHAPAERNS